MSEFLEITQSISGSNAVSSHFGLIVDIVIGLLFLLFGILHGKRGAYKTFSGFLAVIVAIIIGILGANILTEPVMEKAWPTVEQKVSEQYDASAGKAISEVEEAVGGAASTLLTITHLDKEAEKVLDGSSAVSWTQGPKTQLLALVNVAMQEVVHSVLFLVFTIVGLILFKPINGLIKKILEAPLLKQLDWLGGFIIGLLECFVLLFIVMKVCELRNVSFFRDVQQTSWFVNHLMGL